MSKNPWLKFYPLDWRGDPKLRMCSMAARGLWIEILSLMHEAAPYGHLLVNGKSPTDTQIAVLAGAPSDQITDLLGELETAGVFSRTKDGVIYSLDMVGNPDRFRPEAKRPWIPNPIQRAVWDRDGEKCRYCGSTNGPFHLDHVFPWSRGGKHSVENLVVACQPCNTSKSDMTPEEWVGQNG